MPQKLFGGGGVRDLPDRWTSSRGRSGFSTAPAERALQQRVQRVQRHQADLVAEQFGEFAGELLGFPAQPPGLQRGEDVAVAVRRCLASGPGAEHVQLGDTADGTWASLIDLDAWDDHHDLRLTPDRHWALCCRVLHIAVALIAGTA
jgi:hypothetical protein